MANDKQAQAAQVQKAQRDKGAKKPKRPEDYDFSVPPEVKKKAIRQAEIDTRGGLYSDRIKIDPFSKSYKFPSDRKPTRGT